MKIVNNDKLSGFIPRLNTGPGVYAGECLARNCDGRVQIFIINTTAEDLNLIIPPITLEDFDQTVVPVRTMKGVSKDGFTWR